MKGTFELIASLEKRSVSVIDPSSLIFCVGEGRVQAGLRPSQGRLREAGAAA